MTAREDLHRLIDELPERDAQQLLSDLRGRVAGDLPRLLLEAEEDAATADELTALAEMDDADHRLVSHDEIRRDLAM